MYVPDVVQVQDYPFFGSFALMNELVRDIEFEVSDINSKLDRICEEQVRLAYATVQYV